VENGQIGLELICIVTLYVIHDVLPRELANCLQAIVMLVLYMNHKFVL